jgi:hypothetical protein
VRSKSRSNSKGRLGNLQQREALMSDQNKVLNRSKKIINSHSKERKESLIKLKEAAIPDEAQNIQIKGVLYQYD